MKNAWTGCALPALLLAGCDGGEVLGGADMSGMDGAARSCPVAAPRFGESADSQALAQSPARCGQPAFAWQRSERLGEVGEVRALQTLSADTARVALTLAKVPLPAVLHDVAVEQISYTTQDRGALLAATGLLAYPTDTAGAQSTDVLLVLHGTSGFNDACAPSNDKDTRTLLGALAALGYVVIAPDYIGLRAFGGATGFPHPYLVGQPTAIASLDAVRAAQRRFTRADAPLCAGARFATVGGSQGGHAALWVDRLAAHYAAELTHVGAVATVPPADLLAEELRALRSTVPASANTAAFYATSSAWYGARERLAEVFVAPFDQTLPARLAQSCDGGDELKDKTIKDIFQPALLAAAADASALRGLMPWGCMATENGLTTTPVKRLAPTHSGFGILWVLGEADTLVNPPIERDSFDALCAQGMRMQFLECQGASHTKATTWALPEIVSFIGDRFAGKPLSMDSTCKRAAPTRCRATP